LTPTHESTKTARRRRGRGGFTLIEVMVALAIVAYAMIGLLGLHNRNLTIVGRDQDMTTAILAARELIAAMEVRERFPEIGYTSEELPQYPGFRYEREVVEVMPEVRWVRLRVIFDEGRPDLVELDYYIRDRREPEEDL